MSLVTREGVGKQLGLRGRGMWRDPLFLLSLGVSIIFSQSRVASSQGWGKAVPLWSLLHHLYQRRLFPKF